MAKYRKRPVVVEAFQVPMSFGDQLTREARKQAFEAFCDWARSAGFKSAFWESQGDGSVVIPTLEGTITAQPGDWIIRGVAGEFYPCKPDIFAATYEPVTEQGEDL